MKEKKTVATHNGLFHADDVFAIAALKRLFKVEVSRTRDRAVMERSDLRVDVGGKNNPDSGDFDHHMPGGAGTRENGIPYAAFGLVWREFGVQICGGNSAIAYHLERRLVQSIDAKDCGYSISKDIVEGAMVYSVNNVVSSFNPTWMETGENGAAFDQAVEFAGALLERELAYCTSLVVARDEVDAAIARAEDKRVIVLDRFCPWNGPVFRQEESLYVIYPDGFGNGWRLQGVAVEFGSRILRKPLPASWAGKEKEELAELTGVPDAIFCHRGRFIAGAESKEGIMKLVRIALAQ